MPWNCPCSGLRKWLGGGRGEREEWEGGGEAEGAHTSSPGCSILSLTPLGPHHPPPELIPLSHSGPKALSPATDRVTSGGQRAVLGFSQWRKEQQQMNRRKGENKGTGA